MRARRRRTQRVLAGFVVALAALLTWDVAPNRSVSIRPTEVAGATVERPIATTENLGRLSMPEAAPVSDAAPPLGDVAIAPPPATFTGAPAVAAPPPVQLRKPRFDGVVATGGTWAVIIGVNDYPGSGHDLRSATTDANDVNEALARQGVPGNQRLLIRDGQASADTIRAATEWLVAHSAPDATAVFFFAGHVRKLDAGSEAIVGADGGVVTDAELADILSGLQARRAWIAIAACYSGGFNELVRPGRILTAAAPANSLAYENSAFGRSYLVEYMVQRAMIQERAPTSIEAAFAFSKAEISRDYPNRVPVQYDNVEGELDLRSAAARARPTQSQPQPSPAPSQAPPPTAPSPPPSGGGPNDKPRDPYDNCRNISLGALNCETS